MIRRAVVDDFVGIVFLIGAIRAAHLLVVTRSESSRITEPHKFPLRRAASEKQNGDKRGEALVYEGVFKFTHTLPAA